MHATLLFLLRGKEVLLIHKKTGLGAGKINAPGGKIEKGETAEQAAIREVREEIRVEVNLPKEMGILHFQFVDSECLALRCTVFCASQFQGNPSETDEAEPFWCSFDQIPYEQMWADDALWLPGMLSGKKTARDNVSRDKHCGINQAIISEFQLFQYSEAPTG